MIQESRILNKDYEAAVPEKMKWYLHDRVGMFIHWGLYSLLGHGEWAMSRERISKEEYRQYFDNFNPRDYDPKKWAAMAKNAGIKYAIMTSKHHEGFCLFDSQYTDFKSTNTAFGRDAIREFLDAFREAGIKVGIYYSIIDWHHPDYPEYGDMYAPMRDNEEYREREKEKNFDRYLEYMHAQVKELCTNYGKIDILWFDYAYDNMRGEKWQATKLVRMVKHYQPHIILNNRLEVSGNGFGSIVTANHNEYSGDFVTPEQVIPPDGIRNVWNEPVPWEACVTTNNHWGYCNKDYNFKSPELIIRKLVECTSKGGNMLINVGPDKDGIIPEKSAAIFDELGAWLRTNGESIYGCGYAGIEKPEYGRITKSCSGNVYYYHIFEPVIGPVVLSGLPKDKIDTLELLINGRKLTLASSWVVNNYKNMGFVTLGDNEEYTYTLPDTRDTVIKVVLRD